MVVPNNLAPKVLIATPVSDRHKHLLDSWISHLDKLTYPNFDVLLVDTTPDTENYFELLKTKKVHSKLINVIRHPWDYKNLHVVQMLANAREEIRQFFLKGDYDFLFFLDDDIFVPKWAIQRLVSYNKDCVGFYVHIYTGKDKRPCLLKSGEIVIGKGLELFTWDEIDAYKEFVKKFRNNILSDSEKNLIPFIIKDTFRPQLFKTHGVNLGCLMVRRNVLEEVEFKTHETFIFGEDLWFFNIANDKKFEFWCDTDTRPTHKNTSWKEVIKKGPNKFTDFYIALGPAEADKVVFLKGGLKDA